MRKTQEVVWAADDEKQQQEQKQKQHQSGEKQEKQNKFYLSINLDKKGAKGDHGIKTL